ncbi:MAG: glycoside hydrolase family 3 N-terminal domain-containing protein [Thermoplasmata archaeon]
MEMESGRLMQVGLLHGDREGSRKLLEKIKPVSIIIMSDDFKNLEDLSELIKWIKNLYIKEFKLREPLIAVDQEGGNVARIREINYPPSNYALGLIDNENTSYYSGAITGKELHDLGFHWDLAPVIDVLSNKENASVLERSFGEYVDKVSRNGAAFIRGLQDFGISATAKHFPGNGSVVEDPHEKLPRDRRGIDSVRNTMAPFIRAAEEGVRSIMVSHVAFDAIDEGIPSSLSKKVYKIIRDEMRYGGLVITDSLDMKAISDNFSPGEIVRNSFLNGADILECVDPYLAENIYDHLKNLGSSGIEERLNSLYLERKRKYDPPEEIMFSLSFSVPKWLRKRIMDPSEDIFIYYAGKTSYMRAIISRVMVRLRNIGISVSPMEIEDEKKGANIIIIGKNLHLNGRYAEINRLCSRNSCVFINTGIPYDSPLLDGNIGYVAALGDKYENIISSIYAILGFHDLGFFDQK